MKNAFYDILKKKEGVMNMQKLLDYSNRYIKKTTWKDFALIKLCLCSMGILIGLSVPKKATKPVAVTAGMTFIATYIPLMMKVIDVVEKDCAHSHKEKICK